MFDLIRENQVIVSGLENVKRTAVDHESPAPTITLTLDG